MAAIRGAAVKITVDKEILGECERREEGSCEDGKKHLDLGRVVSSCVVYEEKKQDEQSTSRYIAPLITRRSKHKQTGPWVSLIGMSII